MKTLKSLLLIGAAVLLAGCHRPALVKAAPAPNVGDHPTPAVTIVNERIAEESETIKKNANDITAGSGVVGTTLNDIQSSVPEKNQPAVKEAIRTNTQIASKSEQIAASSDRIIKESATLKDINEQIKTLEKKASDIKAVEAQARADALKKLYSYIVAFWAIGFLLIAGGAIVSFLVNKTMGGTIALMGAIVLGFATASQYYMEQIAQIGAVLLVALIIGGVSMLVYNIVNAHRSSTAVKEIVQMIEILKETMTDDEKNRIFGPNGVASTCTSDITKEVVAAVRGKNGTPKPPVDPSGSGEASTPTQPPAPTEVS